MKLAAAATPGIDSVIVIASDRESVSSRFVQMMYAAGFGDRVVVGALQQGPAGITFGRPVTRLPRAGRDLTNDSWRRGRIRSPPVAQPRMPVTSPVAGIPPHREKIRVDGRNPMSIALAVRPMGRVGSVTRSTVPVTVYGTVLDSTTRALCRTLRARGVEFLYVDLLCNPAVARMLRDSSGARSPLPVVVVDGDRLEAPTPAELEAVLVAHRLVYNGNHMT